MARKDNSSDGKNSGKVSSSVDELLLAAQERGDDSFETGRYLVTFKEGAATEGLQHLGTQGLGMRVANASSSGPSAARLWSRVSCISRPTRARSAITSA